MSTCTFSHTTTVRWTYTGNTRPGYATCNCCGTACRGRREGRGAVTEQERRDSALAKCGSTCYVQRQLEDANRPPLSLSHICFSSVTSSPGPPRHSTSRCGWIFFCRRVPDPCGCSHLVVVVSQHKAAIAVSGGHTRLLTLGDCRSLALGTVAGTACLSLSYGPRTAPLPIMW